MKIAYVLMLCLSIGYNSYSQSFEQAAINYFVDSIMPQEYKNSFNRKQNKWFYNNQLEDCPTILLHLYCFDYISEYDKLGYDSLFAYNNNMFNNEYYIYIRGSASKFYYVKSDETHQEKYEFPHSKLPNKIKPYFIFKDYSFNRKRKRHKTYIQVYPAVSYKPDKILVSIELYNLGLGILAYGIEMDVNKKVIRYTVCSTQF